MDDNTDSTSSSCRMLYFRVAVISKLMKQNYFGYFWKVNLAVFCFAGRKVVTTLPYSSPALLDVRHKMCMIDLAEKVRPSDLDPLRILTTVLLMQIENSIVSSSLHTYS